MRKTLLTGLLVALNATAAAAEPFTLAENGTTRYRIVIADDAPEGIQYAAEELTLFLGQMTGATYETVSDATPPQPLEIVLGETETVTVTESVPPRNGGMSKL